MTRHLTLALAMFGAAALGAAAVDRLHAQGAAPGAYAVIDISSINDPDLFKTLLPKTGPANAAFGGRNIAVTENIVGLEGTPPKRYIIVAFDSMDKAKAWYNSPAQMEIGAIRKKSTNARVFIIDGKVP